MRLTKKLLGYLYRKFNRDPLPVLALRINYAGAAMSWKVADAVLTTTVSGGPGVALNIDLTAYTIATLATFIAAQTGYSVIFQNTDVAGIGARSLLDGCASQSSSNGDHLYIYTSLAYAYMESVAGELANARQQIYEMLRQLVATTGANEWLDELGSYYKVFRNLGEVDAIYGPRIIAEVLRPRSNNIAIEDAISSMTGGAPTTVTDAPAQTVTLYAGGTALSYGLFDVQYTFDLAGSENIAPFVLRIHQIIDKFRAAGCHLRSVNLVTALNDSVVSTSWTESFNPAVVAAFPSDTVTAPTTDDGILVLSPAQIVDSYAYTSGTHVYDGSYQFGADPSALIFYSAGGTNDRPSEIAALTIVQAQRHNGTVFRGQPGKPTYTYGSGTSTIEYL